MFNEDLAPKDGADLGIYINKLEKKAKKLIKRNIAKTVREKLIETKLEIGV